MLNWEELLNNAPKFQGQIGHSKMGYWGPDEDAIFGRYYDGTPISENPSPEEISKYYEFWIALSSSEQKEVYQAIFDVTIAENFQKTFQGKAPETVIDGAIEWWDKHYPWEVKEFLAYIAWKKGTLQDPSGFDRTKVWKFKGAVPQRVKQLVAMVNPELIKYAGNHQTPFEKYFYKTFKKAIIGGD